MADKIDQIKIGSTSYDIDLPPDATPSIDSITLSGLVKSTSNATYGLSLPNTSGWTANRTIPTLNDFPNVTFNSNVVSGGTSVKSVTVGSDNYNFSIDTSNLVTLSDPQTITGSKTFQDTSIVISETDLGSSSTIATDGAYLKINASSAAGIKLETGNLSEIFLGSSTNKSKIVLNGNYGSNGQVLMSDENGLPKWNNSPIIKQYGTGPITASGTSCTLTFTVYSYDTTKYSIMTASDFSSKIVNELLANAIIDSSHTITGTVNISGTSYTISSYNKSTKTLTLSNSSTLNLSTITSAYFYTYPYMAYVGCDTSNLRTFSTAGYYFTAGTNGSISAKGLYEHNVRIYNSSSNFSVTFKFTDNYSSAYTYTTISYYLYNRGFTGNTVVCPANGVYGTSSALNLITGVYGYSNSSYYWLYFRYIPLVSYSSSTATINNTVSGESSTSITLTSSFTVQDKVRQL